MKSGIALGREKILAVLELDWWRTVQRKRKKDAAFNKLFLRDPITGRPFVIIEEVMEYRIGYNRKSTGN